MQVNEIIKKYKAMQPQKKRGLNLNKMTKKELIHLVQKAEGNQSCFKGEFSKRCGHTDCCWYNECRK
jgi:hypothetical protein